MRRRISLTFIIIISILLTACMNQSDNKPKKVEQKEKAPKALTTVSDGIDELLDSIDSIAEIMDLSESDFQIQRNQKDKKENQPKKESDGGAGQENKKQDNNQGQNQGQSQGQSQQNTEEQKKIITKDEELFLKWKEVDKKLKEVHEGWNSYEVESVKKGVNSDKSNELKKNLNTFTVAIGNRQIKDIVDTGSEAIGSLAPFFDLYKDEIRGDLSRVKYSIYQSFLEWEDGNQEAANNLLNKTGEYTARVRQKLDKDEGKTKNLDRLSLAISDMKLALEDNNIELLKIKRDIALNNIKSLQE